jgi:hypothetical protein
LKTSPICRANSRVGTITKQAIPSERLLTFELCKRSIKGMANAAVLPVPVCAIARTSSFFIIDGIDLNWISVGRMKPASAKFDLISFDIL